MVIFVAPVSHCVELALFSVDFSGKLPKYVAADLRLHSIHPSITRESKWRYIMKKINLRELYPDVYGAVREVMKELLRSDLRFHKTDCGRFGAMTAWGLKDTSSRPAKDLGGTLRHTIRTMLRSYDSRASGDLLCSHRQGAWQI